jgi:hypothetical protein
VVAIPHKKHPTSKKLEIRIFKKEVLKFFIFGMLVGIPRINKRIKKFLFSLPIQGIYKIPYFLNIIQSKMLTPSSKHLC